MDGISMSFRTVMLFQITNGTFVNVLLVFYMHTVFVSSMFNTLDMIFSHLKLANTMILLTLGIPETLPSPSTPKPPPPARIKARLPSGVILSFPLSWGLNLLVDLSMSMYMPGPKNSSSVKLVLDLKYCIKVSVSAKATLLITILFSLHDLFFMWLMSAASGYLVFVLYRQHRGVRHFHGPRCSPGAMAEVMAAKRVMALVTFYVLLYGWQSIMLRVILNIKDKSPLLVNCQMVL
ncbi:olfactory receptor class A-like protein 1 [Tachyglossus aculeatus]|uniref:olfactory receptor class A-like protein 1 n=1 Tax=Tachyglossus aculeatus TaxID=9261 RepID=UPI0018F725A0|nr:olfactory receptor class A-like protein 1 [Tachyglossus aculeatus]